MLINTIMKTTHTKNYAHSSGTTAQISHNNLTNNKTTTLTTTTTATTKTQKQQSSLNLKMQTDSCKINKKF